MVISIMKYSPPRVDRTWGIWGSYFKMRTQRQPYSICLRGTISSIYATYSNKLTRGPLLVSFGLQVAECRTVFCTLVPQGPRVRVHLYNVQLLGVLATGIGTTAFGEV